MGVLVHPSVCVCVCACMCACVSVCVLDSSHPHALSARVIPIFCWVTPHLCILRRSMLESNTKFLLCFGAVTSIGPVYISDLLRSTHALGNFNLLQTADSCIPCIPSFSTPGRATSPLNPSMTKCHTTHLSLSTRPC